MTGNDLVKLRKTHSLSQERLAALLDVTRSTVYNWESYGNNEIDPKNSLWIKHCLEKYTKEDKHD